MPEKRKKYDREFRVGAVRIDEETGKPIAQVARDLGMNEGTLGNWVNVAREAAPGPRSGPSQCSSPPAHARLRCRSGGPTTGPTQRPTPAGWQPVTPFHAQCPTPRADHEPAAPPAPALLRCGFPMHARMA